MTQILPITTTSAVTAGRVFTVDVPLNVTHHQINFDLINLTKAQVTNIKVKIGSKTFQEYSDLQELDDLNDYWGRIYQAAQSIFYFRRQEFADINSRDMTGLGLLGVASCSIECTIDAAAVNPDIYVESIVDIGEPLGLITKISRQTVPFVAAGWNDISKMPRIGMVMAYHLKKSDVNEVVLKRDNVDQINSTKSRLEGYQKGADHRRLPITSRFTHLDFILQGEPENGLEVLSYADNTPVGTVHARVNLGTPGDVTVLTESLDSIGGA